MDAMTEFSATMLACACHHTGQSDKTLLLTVNLTFWYWNPQNWQNTILNLKQDKTI